MLIRSAPRVLFELPGWIKKGRAYTKNEVASRMPLRVSALPYNQALLAYLREEKREAERSFWLPPLTRERRMPLRIISPYLMR